MNIVKENRASASPIVVDLSDSVGRGSVVEGQGGIRMGVGGTGTHCLSCRTRECVE